MKRWLFERKRQQRILDLATATRKEAARIRREIYGPRKDRRWRVPKYPTKAEALRHWDQILDEVICCARGITDVKTGIWFYRLFLGDEGREGWTPEDVRRKLEEAYWIEEEDIYQEILTIIWKFQLHYHEGYWLKYNIGTNLKRWLASQKVMSRKDDEWLELYENQYKEHLIDSDPAPDISIVLDPPQKWYGKTLFDRYFLYLTQTMDLEIQEISAILITTTKQIQRYNKQTKELENAYQFAE